MGISSLLLGKWMPTWLLEVLTTSSVRLTLLGCWGGLSLLAMLITVWAKRKTGLATTVLRKIYHILIVLVFTPGILLDLTLAYFASAAVMMLFCLLEFIRIQGIEPIASIISAAFYTFLDEKDTGELILSHIYLVVGVATPLWLNPCPFDATSDSLTTPSLLPLLAGVLAVGVGDTAASVGGTYFGRKKWSGTKKTVEGSFFGVIVQMIAVGLLVALEVIDVTWAVWGRLLLSISLVAVVEALTDQVDNIVLPLLLYTSLMDL
ncbi:hypothetical protein SK128_026193 [Halocaridina rubra]|uniref:dolichol kinase n=1 Tax=Halocaridina rubra TaxID=373956 RepID=A0AAN8WPR9_HALRR